MARSKAVAVFKDGQAPIRASKLPAFTRFPLLVLLNFALSTLLHSFASPYIGAELASVSRNAKDVEGWEEFGVLAGWRGIELALGWWGGYDSYDLAALVLLGQSPTHYLVSTFYHVSISTAIFSLAIDAIATYIPFRLLRPLSHAHTVSSTDNIGVPNKDIVTDTSIQIYATCLAASIYGVTLYAAYQIFLPRAFVLYFEGIPDISTVYTATLISLAPLSLVLGLAAKIFIFTPAAATVPSSEDVKNKIFDPSRATLGETLWWNVWGYSSKTKTVIKRTATLVLVTFGNTLVQSWWTVEGIEGAGAAAWAGTWGIAGLVVGAALGVVVNV